MEIKNTTSIKQEFGDFSEVAMTEASPKWQNAQKREIPLYKKEYDLRSEFERDSHRILHSNAYRRLKHKTQVFFATNNDHICTRIEHVTHVASIAGTISKFLNLNSDLVQAIATGHDLGHAPFGHQGEYILRDIAKENGLETGFWHEGNSLRFIDKIETLPDEHGRQKNLNLTYAVRDGIVCHCGEVDDKALRPRDEAIDLETIKKAGQISSYTYEGSVVKISDKIAYLGRDIEDALTYKILTENQKNELEHIIQKPLSGTKLQDINTTFLMHYFIIDLCKNSSPDAGLCFSQECFDTMKLIKDFNLKNIYRHPKLKPFKGYAKLVIDTIFNLLKNYYDGKNTFAKLSEDKEFYPVLIAHIEDWLIKYSNIDVARKNLAKYDNAIIYDIENPTDYQKALIDFISGMSDQFAIKIFNEIISF